MWSFGVHDWDCNETGFQNDLSKSPNVGFMLVCSDNGWLVVSFSYMHRFVPES